MSTRQEQIIETLRTLLARAEGGQVLGLAGVVVYEEDIGIICLVSEDSLPYTIVGLRRVDKEIDAYLFEDDGYE